MSFNFGSTPSSTSGPSQGGLFGTSGTPSTTSVFGQTLNAASKPATGGLFGGGPTAGAGAFGSTNNGSSQPSLFGASSGPKPASGVSTPSLFGTASTGTTPAVGLFSSAAGPTSSTGTTGSIFSTSGTSFGGGTFNFGPKKNEGGTSKPVTTQASNPFGSSTPSTSAPTGSTTPAPSKITFNSTTPAGPPPAENGQAKPLFASALTGQQPGGGLFGSAKPADSTQPKPLFAGLNSGISSSAPGGLFNNPMTTPASSGTNITSTTAPASQAPVPTLNFAPASTTPAIQSFTPGTAPTTTLGGLFGRTTATASVPSATSNPLAGVSGVTSTTAPPNSTSASAAKSLFGGLSTSTPANISTPPSATAPASTSNMFGAPAASSTSQPSSTSGSTAPGTTEAANIQAPAGNQPLAASTAGPLPQQSRLQNKTMDEIITRWASDLLKYQKDFQEQAAKVATWDRLLVENGEKIQTLSDSTYEAERSTKEIENQLSTVESQQAELTSWLDRYEGDVDEILARQIGPGENLQGPDQERERTYKIAEKLTDRLDDMGKNITSMIDAINDASANVSKNSKADDPLSHIVRVLNSHLTQLQWIDQNTEVLQAKVAAAQKLGQSISSNGYGGLENDAAESFYRSYTGRR